MRFYLHVHEVGKTVAIDPEGGEYVSLDMARFEAIEGARQLASDRALAGITFAGSIEIATEGGEVLAVVPFEDAFAARSDAVR